MNTHALDTAVALTDSDLLARLPILAAHERSATAELVAHLAALRLRPSLYAAQGYGSLFAYCRHALRLSEDAAANRIHAVRACLKFPVVLDLLASGELSLSAVRMLRRHLTAENHEGILGRARNARRAEIERLIAELAPRPDVRSAVRKLPPTKTSGAQQPVGAGQGSPPMLEQFSMPEPVSVPIGGSHGSITAGKEGDAVGMDAADARPADVPSVPPGDVAPAHPPARGPRPVVQPLSPERYRVQFTIGQDAHDILRRSQTLLRREIPDGDVGVIFERALRLLHEQVHADKFGRATKRGRAWRRGPEQHRVRHDATVIGERTAGGATVERAAPETIGEGTAPEATAAKPTAATPTPATPTVATPTPAISTMATSTPTPSPASPAYEIRIRPGADPGDSSSPTCSATGARNESRAAGDRPLGRGREGMGGATGTHSRYIPKAVKRAVWYRDRAQCAFVSVSGQRCAEREFLELHHIQPYALKGPATAANIALRCRCHNAYEAELVFGARPMPERAARADNQQKQQPRNDDQEPRSARSPARDDGDHRPGGRR